MVWDGLDVVGNGWDVMGLLPILLLLLLLLLPLLPSVRPPVRPASRPAGWTDRPGVWPSAPANSGMEKEQLL